MFVLQNRSTDSNSSGLKNDNEDRVNEFSLSTAFDVTSAGSVVAFIKVKAQDTAPRGLAFNTDGTKMFVLGDQDNRCKWIYFINAFDVIINASFVDSFSVNSQDDSPQGLAFNNDGTKMFVVGDQGNDVNEYTLNAFDVSSASFVDSFSVNSQDGSPEGIAFNNDGTKMFVSGNANDGVYEYTFQTLLMFHLQAL